MPPLSPTRPGCHFRTAFLFFLSFPPKWCLVKSITQYVQSQITDDQKTGIMIPEETTSVQENK